MLEYTRLEAGRAGAGSAPGGDDRLLLSAKKKLPFSTSFHDTSASKFHDLILCIG